MSTDQPDSPRTTAPAPGKSRESTSPVVAENSSPEPALCRNWLSSYAEPTSTVVPSIAADEPKASLN